ncbi:hypothetical protein L6452_38159 [Arctium lappa]|uniref:Uncharacterized protein n=1 Tax=Arctium lappa TaxID=4217 RepID=A0ACB8Y632_ARCLA|nr:hypothetical protein L6452_38159 [Arctium lappa]
MLKTLHIVPDGCSRYRNGSLSACFDAYDVVRRVGHVGSRSDKPLDIPMGNVRLKTFELPMEIVSAIAGRLQIIDLLSLRGSCKDFRRASATASAEFEPYRPEHPFGDDIQHLRQILYLDVNETVLVCVTSYKNMNKPRHVIFLNEIINDPTNTNQRQAVWFRPRFFEIDNNLRWVDNDV